ncbi:MAG: 50S ribosomal protein L21 [Rickettsiales bacterium TMED251]|nr:MAG: 50S ribosomal protein L21 [Rickettsiales bacterium TMED251]|tara:strand:- start:230 stop:670 length:441 start_codon:yes stop_codon:yes gene_type:complete
MFAIIKSGGKQYKIVPGDILKLEYLGIKKGEDVIFKEVLMLHDSQSLEVGEPFLSNAQVQGKVLENKNDKKVIVFKKRRRHNSRRLNGHKRLLSIVKINEISYKGKILAKATQKIKKDKMQETKVEKKVKKVVKEEKKLEETKDGN